MTSGSSGQRILIVDDYEDTRTMYATMLRFAGFLVEEAGDAATGVASARAARPDVILMDVALPGDDGWTATAQLKRESATRDIPVIIITGFGGPSAIAHAAEVGCVACLLKPCLPELLIETVRSAAPARRRTPRGLRGPLTHWRRRLSRARLER